MLEDFDKFDALFHPNSAAIVGASSNIMSGGYNFTRFLIDHGFKGRIYPVNPKLDEILGLKAYASLRDIPESEVDYVISCVSAERVLQLLEDCKAKNVKLVHLFTGILSETGRKKETRLEREILRKAKSLGIRILGPNCMGVYYPEVGLSFNHDLPTEAGPVGGFFQSGGGAGEFVRYAALRGVRFSKVISYGNAPDISGSELLCYFADDPETKVIAAYIEGVKDGREFIRALSYATARKPVIILKAGRGEAGKKLVFSHTASMAGSMDIWRAISKQYGVTLVGNFQELIDEVVAFAFLPPVTRRGVLIVGGGGGKSVISADVWEEEGFHIPQLSLKTREELKKEVPEIWDWVRNPLDSSIFQKSLVPPLSLLKMVAAAQEFDVLVLGLTQDDFYPTDIWRETIARDFLDGTMAIKDGSKPVVSVIETAEIDSADMQNWRWSGIAETRKQVVGQGIPVFPSPASAAKALRKFIDYWVWRERR